MKPLWRCLFVAALLVMSLSAVWPVAAQEDKLTPGEPITGNVTNDAPEVRYALDAPAEAVLAIEVIPVDLTADYDRPRIILQDSSGAELVRRDSFGRTALFWQVPEDGTYMIIVSRADELSVGEFTLIPSILEVLTPGQVVEGRVSTEDRAYFAYNDAADFRLRVTREGGYVPQFSVNQIDERITPGSLDTLLFMGGDFMTDGELGTVPGGALYVLTIQPALLNISFGTAFADYTLEIVPVE